MLSLDMEGLRGSLCQPKSRDPLAPREGTSVINPSNLAAGRRVSKGLPEAAVLRC